MARLNNTKERILDAAEDLFAQKGFAATSVTDIADQVGIRGPGVYKHYPNKAAIYEEVLRRLLEPLNEVIVSISQHSDDTNSLYHQVSTIMGHHLRYPNIAKLIQHATLAGGEPLQLLADEWYKPFFKHIAGIADADTNPLVSPPSVMAFHSLVLGYVTLASLHEKIFDIDPLSESMVEAQLKLHRQMVQGLGMVFKQGLYETSEQPS